MVISLSSLALLLLLLLLLLLIVLSAMRPFMKLPLDTGVEVVVFVVGIVTERKLLGLVAVVVVVAVVGGGSDKSGSRIDCG